MATISIAHTSTSEYYQNSYTEIVDHFAEIADIFANIVDLFLLKLQTFYSIGWFFEPHRTEKAAIVHI